jgi:hypothetical protein
MPWTSGGSGVVVWKPVSSDCPAISAATVVTSPVRRPAAARIAPINDEVVVLPSVPVTPTTVSLRDGNPCQAAESSAQAARPLVT